MTDQRLKQIIERVCKKASEFDWKLDSSTSGYFVGLGNSFVEVRSKDRDDAHPYEFLILDREDNVVEALDTSWNSVTVDQKDMIAQTYGIAKRKASGVDDRLNEILEALE